MFNACITNNMVNWGVVIKMKKPFSLYSKISWKLKKKNLYYVGNTLNSAFQVLKSIHIPAYLLSKALYFYTQSQKPFPFKLYPPKTKVQISYHFESFEYLKKCLAKKLLFFSIFIHSRVSEISSVVKLTLKSSHWIPCSIWKKYTTISEWT